jgi:3',5'-cyclic-AMP phosphodiesterase
MPAKPSFIIHTGDIIHLSKPAEFDNADKVFGETGVQIHWVPGEHDIIDEERGKAYLERYGKGSKGAGCRRTNHGATRRFAASTIIV